MNPVHPQAPTPAVTDLPASLPLLVVRAVIGGILMGLANLVPGISGGTMLLAAGIYPQFIGAISELTTLTFRKASIVLLLSVIAAAGAAIVSLAGPVKDAVVDHRWVMYSLFIGLTLGGVPVIWRLIGRWRTWTSGVWGGLVAGFVAMALLAVVQARGGGGAAREGFVLMFFAGIAGASAMILPGVSGGYLLLILGVYVPILSAIDQVKEALRAGDIAATAAPGLQIILPVGVGVIIGIVAVSNALRWLLTRYEKATLGVLMGLLFGAVVGLWPFQQPRNPAEGELIKGRAVTFTVVNGVEGYYFADTGELADAEDFPTEFFRPTAGHVGGAIGLILGGFAVTMLVDFIGRDRKRPAHPDAAPAN